MRVVIAGGHGGIARRLARLLAERRDHAVCLVRNPQHDADIIAVGAHPERFDLESGTAEELAAIVRDADAVVFAAGAGPGSSAERKDTVDRAGAALLADAAEQAGVRRYLIVSAIGIDEVADASTPTGRGEIWDAYVAAKQAADEDLRSRDLDWTVLRPGGLTDAPGTGLVALAPHVERGEVPREDVAAVLLALLDHPETAHLSLDLVGGDVPIDQAVEQLA
jgi:uncharacterized protein YbjT (DUF2867 family)